MSTILEEIESKIEELKTSTTKSNVGIVRETGDGVARVEGLSDVMLNEMIEFPNGVYGLALNLEETEVGAILLGDNTLIKEGDEAKTTGRLLSVPVGKALLGRVVNTLGQPLDGKGPIKSDTFYPLEKIAPGVIKRRSVNQPVQTGIMATLKLEIVTPEEKIYSEDVEMVTLPGSEGELGVYPKHVPLLTTLVPGELRVVKSGRETTMAIGEGFVEIKGDAVSVLTDMTQLWAIICIHVPLSEMSEPIM